MKSFSLVPSSLLGKKRTGDKAMIMPRPRILTVLPVESGFESCHLVNVMAHDI